MFTVKCRDWQRAPPRQASTIPEQAQIIENRTGWDDDDDESNNYDDDRLVPFLSKSRLSRMNIESLNE